MSLTLLAEINWKYLGFILVPAFGVLSLSGEGLWTFSAVIFSFGLVPLVELLIKPDHRNYPPDKRFSKGVEMLYAVLTCLVLPGFVILLGLFLWRLAQNNLTTTEYLGVVLSFGILCGVMAINVGHELGHRRHRIEKIIGESLLLLAMQAHFLPYHNHGHHRNVATPNDPATAKKNEPLFFFWFRSQTGSYLAAWRIEWLRLTQRGKSPLTLSNRMIRYTIIQGAIVVAIVWFYSIAVLLTYLLSCAIGILLLETVNYIEHYGLIRQQDENGKYERVTPRHSWNSDHRLGRVLLFELSRHSDHHANPAKPYYKLNSFAQSPQMPTGYPGMMLLSLIPPLWFKVMNRQLIEQTGTK